MVSFDRHLASRTFALTLLALLLAAGVAAATDEPSSTFRTRLARLCAFAPALAGLGQAVALGQARQRGELRALHALGRSPWRVALGATACAWGIGGLAAGLAMTPWADVTALFPMVSAFGTWHLEGSSMTNPAAGIRVAPNGALTLPAISEVQGATYRPEGGAAGLAIGALALALPPWVSAPLRLAPRLAVAALGLILAIVMLHAVAAERLGIVWLIVPALPVGVHAVWGHGRP